MEVRTALEWYDQNMHTDYPLVGTSSTPDSEVGMALSGEYLPKSFIVDIQIIAQDVPDGDAEDRFFVSRISSTGESLTVEISYMTPSLVQIPCARSAAIPKTVRNTASVQGRTFQLAGIPVTVSGYETLADVSGVLVVGSCIDMDAIGIMEFGYGSGAVISSRVMKRSADTTSILVEDSGGVRHTLSGDFSLRAGDGISITVDGAVIRIDKTQTAEESELALSSIDDIIEAVRSRLGNPVRRINGVSPSGEGNFFLAGGDCVTVTQSGNGVVLANSCAKPCCTDAQTSSDLESTLALMEQAVQRLTSYYEALTTNIGAMQSRLSSLIAAGS